MCGRIATNFEVEDIKEEFKPDKLLADFSPRFNVAPSQEIPVIVHGSRVFDMYRWGLVPHWAKDTKSAMINARSETLLEKHWFRDAFLSLRCLILVSGFYEWDKSKNPHYIYLKDKKVFALAGIANIWKSGEKSVKTCCIVTTEANEFMKEIHHRMPSIISSEHYQDWINPKNKDLDFLQSLLIKPFNGKMTEHEVSKAVNTAANDFREVLTKTEAQGKLGFE